MLVLTNEFFIMHLLFYSQKLDHILLKSDTCIAFCYFKIWVLILFFLQDFAKTHFQKGVFSEWMTNDQEVQKEEKNNFYLSSYQKG